MVEIYKQHSLSITPWKNWINIQNRHFLAFTTFIFGVYIVYAVWVNRLTVMSPELTMPLTALKLQTNRSIPHDYGQSMIGTTESRLHFSKYIIASGNTAEIQYNLTEVTQRRSDSMSTIEKRSTNELELELNKDLVRNPITRDFYKSHFMTISFMARLGNNMFQLAALLSCAKRLNYTAFIRSDALINTYFVLPITSDMKLTNVKTFWERMYAKYDSDIENLDTSINWTLAGYYQSWKYFYKDEDLILKSFEFRPNIYEPARQFVDGFRSENKTIVGIHVRRGDMATDRNEMLGYATAPLTYINKSMNYFREKYNNTFFIIVSDAIPWCKENIRGNNDTAFSNFTNPGCDMAVLSFCDHVIVTSGTFGWWGAWLAGGDVVYFKGFPKPGSEIDKGMRHEDYYPPHWLGME